MAGKIQVISTNIIRLADQNSDLTRKIDLGPWDVQVLLLDFTQVGFLLPHSPKESQQRVIQHLKTTLPSALDFFPHLAGRLRVVEHDDGTSSFSVLCNNSGALFIHALAEGMTMSDILLPVYLPPIVRSFYPLTGVKTYQGTHNPLLAVQFTELADGFFVGCTMNQALGDGKSMFHFLTCWSEIARGVGLLTPPPTFERWFPEGIERPIRIRFPKDKEMLNEPRVILPERVFHFSKEKIAQLKAKANASVGPNYKISSLQALMGHLWRAMVRNQGIDPNEDVSIRLVIDIRQRVKPPFPLNYFGNTLEDSNVTMKAGELLQEDGHIKAALEMNKEVASYTHENIVTILKSWLEDRTLLTIGDMFGDAVDVGGSPTFGVYGLDFGWGNPLTVRSGPGDKSNGTVIVFAGPEEGDLYVEVILAHQALEAMGNDPEFMDAVTPSVGFLTAAAVKKLITASVRSSL